MTDVDDTPLGQAVARSRNLREHYRFVSQFESPDLDDLWDEAAADHEALLSFWAATSDPGEETELSLQARTTATRLAENLLVDTGEDLMAWCAEWDRTTTQPPMPRLELVRVAAAAAGARDPSVRAAAHLVELALRDLDTEDKYRDYVGDVVNGYRGVVRRSCDVLFRAVLASS